MEKAIHLLLHPSAYLLSLSRYLSEESMKNLIYWIVNEDYLEVINYIDEMIEEINESPIDERDKEQIILSLQLSQFKNTLKTSYAYVQDLIWHKSNTDVMYLIGLINNELKKNNIDIPNDVLIGIQEKVQEGVRKALTPDDEQDIFQGLSDAQLKRKQAKLNKLNKLK